MLPDKRTMQLKRTFSVGEQGRIFFPVAYYPALKNFFEQIQKADTLAVTFKLASQ
jgi:hypothetical protein